MTEERQRLLIATQTLALLRAHHENTIVALVRAGVQVSVRYRNEKGLSAETYREILLGRGCSVSVSPLPQDLRPSFRDKRPGDLLGFRLRQMAELLRYYHPDYGRREWLRERWLVRTSPGPRKWARRIGRLGSHVSLFALRLASSIDRVLPPSEPARALLASEQPDAVVAVAMVWNPELADLLKAAARERVPTASWIQSWDNLSSKGLLHFTPDRVFVWNATQSEELVRYHRVPERHVCITGAQSFDQWFNGDAPSDRASFCVDNGIDPERPIILYLVSSPWLEPTPEVFFLPWLEAIRSSGDPALEEAFVLVRPHPNARQFGLDLRASGLGVSPGAAEARVHSAEFRRRYRDELHHATVAVGINTSAMIEAAIFGKPVCTVELPELADRQRGTVHFEYLVTAGGGLLRTAASFEEHTRMLGDLIRRDTYGRDEQSARFVRAFVRPHGIDVAPGTVFLDGMLRLLQAPSELRLPSLPARAIGRIIYLAAPMLGAPFEKGPHPRFLRVVLPRSSRAGVRRIRHFVLIVLPLGIRVRLTRLRLGRQPATLVEPASTRPSSGTPPNGPEVGS